eukprot:768074-Hanusia_phi.AAC.11
MFSNPSSPLKPSTHYFTVSRNARPVEIGPPACVEWPFNDLPPLILFDHCSVGEPSPGATRDRLGSLGLPQLEIGNRRDSLSRGEAAGAARKPGVKLQPSTPWHPAGAGSPVLPSVAPGPSWCSPAVSKR